MSDLAEKQSHAIENVTEIYARSSYCGEPASDLRVVCIYYILWSVARGDKEEAKL